MKFEDIVYNEVGYPKPSLLQLARVADTLLEKEDNERTQAERDFLSMYDIAEELAFELEDKDDENTELERYIEDNATPDRI